MQLKLGYKDMSIAILRALYTRETQSGVWGVASEIFPLYSADRIVIY